MQFKAVIGVILVFGMGVSAQEGQRKEPVTSEVQTQTSVNVRKASSEEAGFLEKGTQHSGVVVVVDPTTRQIRQATPQEIGALRGPATAVTGQPTIIQGPGGAVGVVLGPEFQMHLVATKTNGKVVIEEVSYKAAEDHVSTGRSATSVDDK